MGKRPASSKATRGASKGKKPTSSSSSNPKIRKFRSQINNLAVIAKGGPSKKAQNKEAMRKLAKDAVERKELLNGLDGINMLGVPTDAETHEDNTQNKKVNKKSKKKASGRDDNVSEISGGSKLTVASFASIWSNCTNSSLNEFFQVWNPNLETHKDALAVIAGLSQIMSSEGTEQSDIEYTKTLFRVISSENTPTDVLTGALLALTFVMRKLPKETITENFDLFYPILKNLMEKHHGSKRKSLNKSLIRCIACLTKAHPLGKAAINSSLRKTVNIAIRQHKVQDKVRL